MKTLLYIGNKLAKHGFTPTSIETLGSFLSKEGYKMYYASDKKKQWWRLWDMVWSVLKNKNKVDYVIIDTYSTTNFWYAFIISQWCRMLFIKYIPILHGGMLPDRLDKNPKLSKMIFDHAYKNVAPSGYLMDAFQKRDFTNLAYIPNTIQLEEYPFLKEREATVPRLLWVRSFASIYNPKMAVEVLKKIQETHPTATLCMVGPDKDGSLEKTKSYAEKLKVEVTFTGKLSKEKWIELSKEYNVFINTTHFDNTPVSVIEAMCLGLPVVTTKVGGLPFLVEDRETALLVEDNSVVQMANRIYQLFVDEVLRQKLVINGKSHVQSFDWQEVKKKWNGLLIP